MHLTTLLPFILLPTTFAIGSTKPPKNAILLSNVKTLTLRANAKTTHRRVSAIPQLTCVGSACKHHTVDIMRCTNQGADYEKEDIQWSCTANLPAEFKLGSTEVTCEGYSSSKDEYVLKGSCGVEYKLLLTEKGHDKYGEPSFFDGGDGSGIAKFLFMALFFAVGGWILWSMYQAWRNPALGQAGRRPGAGGGNGFGGWGPGGGGGGGGNGFDDPPPPYPGTGKRYGTTQPAAPQQGYRPGFWTGAMGGAAAGYMAGNRGGRQQPPPQQQRGWFGGGNDNGEGSSSWGSSRRTSSSSSGARHESTGFGSTSRR